MAEEFAKHIQENLSYAKTQIKKAQESQTYYADKKRRDVSYDIGEEVLVHSENITVDNQKGKSSAKLANRYIGPFKINEKIGPVAY